MTSELQQSIDQQRKVLKSWLSASLSELAQSCRDILADRHALESRLVAGLNELPYCKYLYVLNDQAQQITANVSRNGPLDEYFKRDRRDRPYLAEALAGAAFSLSEAYISRNARRPSLTAIHRIEDKSSNLVGFLGADFDLRELPMTQSLYEQPQQWVQLKGDPAIRANLFQQKRIDSQMDEHIEQLMAVMMELITLHGVFHAKMHFSSSRVTLWLMDDPYRFRLHSVAELTSPDVCLAYPHRTYPANAVIPPEAIRDILKYFRDLRFMDETLYLRSGMLNIFNGMIGLTFSCDGSHYIPWQEFLDNKMNFWLGT